jgi:hypothetical protein
MTGRQYLPKPSGSKPWARENSGFDSIPFLAKGIAIDDLVEGWSDGAGEEGMLHFSRKLETGGHSTIQTIVLLDEVAPYIKNEVTEIGCGIEVSPWPSLFSIDIPDYNLLGMVHRLLDARASLGQLEYEDACLAGPGGDGPAA